MKKLLRSVCFIGAVGLFASQVFAQQGMGMGPGMGMGHMGQYYGAGKHTDYEKIKEYNEAWLKHYADTTDLWQKVWLAKNEMTVLMMNPKTSKEEALKKQKELHKLKGELHEKKLIFRFALKEKFPEMHQYMGGHGYGYGMGMGRHGMMGGGMGMGCGMMGPGMMGMGHRGMMGYGMGMGCGMMGHGMGMGPGWYGEEKEDD